MLKLHKLMNAMITKGYTERNKIVHRFHTHTHTRWQRK